MDPTETKQYLDDAIVLWRDIRDGKTPAPPEHQVMAEARIDAFQSVRLVAFGGLLPEPDAGDPTRIPDSPGLNVSGPIEGAPLWTSEEVHELFRAALERQSPAFRDGGDYAALRGSLEDSLRAEITERCASLSSSQ